MFTLRQQDPENPSQEIKKHFSMRDIVVTFSILILFGFVLWIGHYGSSRLTELGSKNKSLLSDVGTLQSENESLRTQNQTLSAENSKLKEELELLSAVNRLEQLRAKGINPDILEIKSLDIQTSWQISGVSYEATRAYLTPDISDLGSLRENPDMNDKRFVMLEINIRDFRSSGEMQLVPVNEYLKLSSNNNSYTSFTQDYLSLPPKETGSVYYGFAVEKDENVFELRLGFVTNPEILNLDFESTEVAKLEGVFMLQRGFGKEYKEN